MSYVFSMSAVFNGTKAFAKFYTEVLLNTVLDACIHLKALAYNMRQLHLLYTSVCRQDNRRLGNVLRQFERATLKPSVQNYGLLIKA